MVLYGSGLRAVCSFAGGRPHSKPCEVQVAKATVTCIGCIVRQGHAQPVDAEVKFPMLTTKKVDAFSWPWLLSAGIMAGHLSDLLQ